MEAPNHEPASSHYIGWYNHGPANIILDQYENGRYVLSIYRQNVEKIHEPDRTAALSVMDSEQMPFNLYKTLVYLEAYKIDQ